jgi:putative two-component system response regulator
MKGRKKILIVDDSEMNRSLLTDMLSDEYDIIETEDGMQAATVLHNQEQEISLVLLDIVMPTMDGFELLALMNRRGWIKTIPVIMISAETVSAYVDRAYDLGVTEYISRPFDERTVRHRVKNTIMLTAKQKELSRMLTEQVYEKEKSNRLMIEILSNIVEFRNGESGLHVLHIQTITEVLLTDLIERGKIHMNEVDKYLISTASALHDIGKIAIPTEILNKPGKLTPEEFEIMKTHSAEGAKLLNDLPLHGNEPLVQFGYQICRWHHERYDGGGYPDGLKGDAIPIAAQVVALADVYDALTSVRVYKPPFSHEVSVQMILNGECGAFSPMMLECLQSVAGQLEAKLRTYPSEQTSELEIMKAVDRMVKGNEVEVSERSLTLLERERMKYRFVSDMTNEIVFEYTALPEMITLSTHGAEYLGLPETIQMPRDHDFGRKVFTPEDFTALLDALRATTPEEPSVEMKCLLEIRGSKRWCKVYARSLWGTNGGFIYEGAIGKIVDIHDEMQRIRELERRMNLDMLTGLMKRTAAQSQIEAIMQRKNERRNDALIVIDLDNFQEASTAFGHHFGDEVLQYVADTLRNCVRGSDIVARLGSAEFMVFVDCSDSPQIPAQRIFERLSSEYHEYIPAICMGIAMAEQEDSFDALLHRTDIALCSLKKEKKNGYRFYDDVPQKDREALESCANEHREQARREEESCDEWHK